MTISAMHSLKGVQKTRQAVGGVCTLPNGLLAYRYHWKPGTVIYVGNTPHKLEHCYIDGGVLLSNGDWYPKVVRADSGKLVARDR